jgi:hypothetical protein
MSRLSRATRMSRWIILAQRALVRLTPEERNAIEQILAPGIASSELPRPLLMLASRRSGRARKALQAQIGPMYEPMT